MNRGKILGLFAAGVAALSLGMGVASAEGGRHGWYVGLDAGASFVNDVNMKSTPNHYVLDAGWAGFAVVGYKFNDPSLRLEFEAGLRDSDLGELNGVSVTQGQLKEFSGFANLLWDASSSTSNWGLTLGAGIGIDNARLKDHVGVDSRDLVQAAQGIVGLNYRIGDDWDCALTYRLLFTQDGQYDTTAGLAPLTGEADFIKHAVTLGFRYGYDDPPPPPAVTPPPPPPPPASPPPPKQFIVFFGFAKSNLTPEAQAVVSEAAAAAKAQGAARITIVGHTDTVGSAANNDALSLRRASAVKDELSRLGISPDAITASGKGETELMVQTGDGVKEPQNRRATIDL